MPRAIRITSASGALTVNVTGPAGNAPVVYADSAFSATVTLPATVADSTQTTFWLGSPGAYTLSVKTSAGTEIASDNNTTRTVDLETPGTIAALTYDARLNAPVAGDSGHSTAGSVNAASGAPAVTAVGNAGSSQTFAASGTAETAVYTATLNAASLAVTLSGGTTGKRCVVELWLSQDATGGRVVSWPANVNWTNKALPVLSTAANATDIVTLVTMDGGTTFSELPAVVGIQATTVPDAPTGVTATAAGPAQVNLTWNAAAPNGSAVTAYKVYRSTTTGTETLLTTLGNVTTYSDTGLTAGTTYFYKISAVNGKGEGAQSGEVSATTGSSFVLNDQFTGTNGTNLTAHTADTGQAWTADTGAITIQGNKAQPTYVATVAQRYDITPGTSLLGKTVESSVTHSAARVKFHLAFLSADGLNRLEVWVSNSGGTAIQLQKQVAGSGTTLASASSPTVTLGATVVYQVVIPASLANPILVKQGGVTVISFTLSAGDQTAFGSNTKVGVGAYTDTLAGTGDDGTTVFDYLTVA